MKYGYILTTLFCLLATTPTFTQTTCPGPAPNQFTVVSQTHTEIELAWQTVTAAQVYEIRTYEAGTGNLINTDTTSVEHFLQDGLQPGGVYNFELRSSYCANGPFGPAAQLTAQANIVVVDIIFQFECLDQMDDGQVETVEVGDLTMIEMPEDQNGCYILSFTNPNNPSGTLSLILSNDFQNQLNVGSLASNSPDLQLAGNGPLVGMINEPLQPRPSPMFSMEMKTEEGLDPLVTVQWEQATDVSVVYCSDCGYSAPGMGLTQEESTIDRVSTMKIHPNPAQDGIQIFTQPMDGTLEVFDLSGRLWYQRELTAEQATDGQRISVSEWPNGAYFARFRSAGSPPIIQSFMKLNN